jgi:hypothetical protein
MMWSQNFREWFTCILILTVSTHSQFEHANVDADSKSHYPYMQITFLGYADVFYIIYILYCAIGVVDGLISCVVFSYNP